MAPEPPNTRLEEGSSARLEETIETVSEERAESVSPMVKGKAPVDVFTGIERLTNPVIVGAALPAMTVRTNCRVVLSAPSLTATETTVEPL